MLFSWLYSEGVILSEVRIMIKIKITINTDKLVTVSIKETKAKQDDIVNKISSLLKIERGKLGNERCSIENC